MGEKAFFQSQVSFDIDDEEKKTVKRRRPRRHREKRQEDQVGNVSSCPGCGGDIDEDTFLDCITSFAIGVHDYSMNDPIRTRFIQTLRNEIANLPTPKPKDAWVMEIVNRIEQQMTKLLDAERLRRSAEMENNLRQELEVEIRRRVEEEIWAQVEAKLNDGVNWESE